MERWSDDDKLMLLTPEEIQNLPDGAILTSINGQTMTWSHQIEAEYWDTRYGVTAWGLIEGKAEFLL